MRNASARNRRVADDDEERRAPRPWWWRLLLRRPRDTVAFLVAAGAAGAIMVNGLYFQRGPHPAPIFAVKPLPVAAVRPPDHVAAVPRPRPLEPEAPKRDLASARTHTDGIDPRARSTPPAIAGPRKDPIAELLATRAQPAAAPPQAQPAVQPPQRSSAQPSRQVLAVQRALSDFGYGQLKPTGVYDPETRVAIQHFERDHKLPITGEISERVTRELANVTGRAMD